MICTEHYTDCDIRDCHPTLIVQMCEHHKLPCDTLKRYIEQRSDLIAETGLEKRDFKKLFFNAVLYNPQCSDEQLQSFAILSGAGLVARLKAGLSCSRSKYASANV